MLDHGAKWPTQPDWAVAALTKPGLRIRTITGLDQHLVGGNLAVWCSEHGAADAGIGAFALAEGSPYRVRLSRDRLLLVGTGLAEPGTGWCDSGYAVTDISAGYHLFEVSGSSAPALLARGTTLDPAGASPSAALQFAGASVVLYRHAEVSTFRIHVDRALAAYLWSWFETVAKAMPDPG